MTTFDLDLSKYDLGWSDQVEYAFTPQKGIDPGVVEQISWWKGEPQWMIRSPPALQTSMSLPELKKTSVLLSYSVERSQDTEPPTADRSANPNSLDD